MYNQNPNQFGNNKGPPPGGVRVTPPGGMNRRPLPGMVNRGPPPGGMNRPLPGMNNPPPASMGATPAASTPGNFNQPHSNNAPNSFAPNTIRRNASQPGSSTFFREVKLWANNIEREKYENLADLYSILKTTEAIERAYIRDALPQQQYKSACKKLQQQFKTAEKITQPHLPNGIQHFMKDFKIDHVALERLKEGVTDNDPKIVAETVQHFITLMDQLKLDVVAVDELHPYVKDLVDSLKVCPSVAKDPTVKTKVSNWLNILDKMKATDELSEEQVRQMLFDLDNAYSAFHKTLK